MSTDRAEITDSEVESFRLEGYLIKEALYTSEEVALIRAVAEADPRKDESHGRGGAKAESRRSELWSIGNAGPKTPDILSPDVTYDAICFGERMLAAQSRLLLDTAKWPDDSLTLHHRKFILKDQFSYQTPEQDETGQHGGNGFQWHQDYWYWGDYTKTGSDAYGGPGRPYPDLLIALIALDEHTWNNGCLQVIAGSHRHRLNYRAEQWGERHAIREEVEELIADGHEHVWCEMSPGSVVFFTPETLHQSFPNGTSDPRWAFICCFDTMHNRPNGVTDWRKPAVPWSDDLLVDFGSQHLRRLRADT